MKSAIIPVILLATIAGVFARDIPDTRERDGNWWKHATVYEVWLKSFQDSDGDGNGDFKGLISRLDYLKSLGVDTIYLSPFYPSGGADGGFDITNFKDVDTEVYGEMKDFEQLIEEMKARNLYLITDLIMNHTSIDHEWFQKSVKKIEPYTDYYVWVDPEYKDGKRIPPNNWYSILNFEEEGSAWTWNEEREQYYYHQFMIQQPDLNLRNPKVMDEIKEIIEFWLEKGVSGFRVDAAMVLMEDEERHNNPPLDRSVSLLTNYDQFIRTANHPDTFKFLHELYDFLREYDEKNDRAIQTPLIGEIWGTIEKTMKYFGTDESPVIHMPYNFLLTLLEKYKNAKELVTDFRTYLSQLPKGRPSNWALGSHDGRGRPVKLFNPEYNYILLALVSMLPGTSSVYYGEELGMSENKLIQSQDPIGRDKNRTPMQWNDRKNAGFTSAKEPWVPVEPNFWHTNVEYQSKQENSSLKYFKDLMSLRKTNAIKSGDLKFYTLSTWFLAFSRTDEKTSYIILMNLGAHFEPLNLTSTIENIATTSTVIVSSPNSGYKKGTKIDTSPNGYLRPNSVLILGTEYVPDDTKIVVIRN